MNIFGNFGNIKSKEDIIKNLGTDPDVDKYWKLCMATLEQSILNAREEFENTLKKNSDTFQGIGNVFDIKVGEFKKHLDNCSWDDNDMYLSPTEFYTKFFSRLINPSYLSNSKVKGWRDLYENIGAKQQCKVAQRLNNNPVVDWNTCYICGNAILDIHNPVSYVNPIHSSRECEHIINAFTALGYKGLIQRSNFTNEELDNENLMRFFNYEYANAHQCCNQIKSDDKWLKRNDQNYDYIVDKTALHKTIKEISVAIQNKSSYDCGNLNNFDIKNRVDTVIDKYLNNLLFVINKDAKDYQALFDISIRINQITALQLNVEQLVHSILYGVPLPTTSKNSYKIRKAELYCKSVFRGETNENTFMELFIKIHSLLFGQELNEFTNSLLANNIINSFNGIDKSNRLGKNIWHNNNELDKFGNQTKTDALLYIKNNIYQQDEGIAVDFNIIQNVVNYHILLRKINYLDLIERFFNNVPYKPNVIFDQIAKLKEQNINSLEQLKSSGFLSGGNIRNKINKKIMGKKKLIGGNKLTQEEIISDTYAEELENLKETLIEQATQHGIDPRLYGINITQTKSGRISSTPIKLSYCNVHDNNGNLHQVQCFNLDGLSFYIAPSQDKQYPNGYIVNTVDNQIVAPIEWVSSKGKGFYTNNNGITHFHIIGGKKKKTIKRLKNKKSKNYKKNIKRTLKTK
jgi:hypothetical protein